MAWYYGWDGSTSGFPTCKGAEPPFYIGRIGAGASGFKNSDFNTTTAKQAAPPQTFVYWDLEGPRNTPSSMTNTQWGTTQAQAFVKAWQTGVYSGYVGGRTFFLDIESGNSGWTVGTETDRREILIGALDYLSNVSNVINEPGSAGVYTTLTHGRHSLVATPHRIRLFFGTQAQTPRIVSRRRQNFRPILRLRLEDGRQ